MIGIYMIRCKPNGKVYVGESEDIEKRLIQKELAKYLKLDRITIDRILKSKKPYIPKHKKNKHLEGIKIIKIEEENDK